MIENANKPALEREALRDVIDLALWAGQLMLQHGADSRRVEETIHHIGTGLGCDWMDILVSPNVLIVTTISGQEFRTKVRRVVRFGVNMTMIAEVNDLSRSISEGRIDRFAARQELERIDQLKHNYGRWTLVFMVGLSCGAFSQLFGGDLPVFMVTALSSALAMFVRQELQKRHFNTILVVVVTAFVAGLAASSASLLKIGNEPQLAMASSVLLLVPGVPLINSAEDLIEGHVVMGLVRGFMGGLITLAIALGLLLAMSITGVGL